MILLGSDHGGFILKQQLKTLLTELGIEVTDLGAFTHDPQDDYPEVAHSLSSTLLSVYEQQPDSLQNHVGVLICTTAGGVMIAANRHAGIRAVHCRSIEDAEHARAHNHANIIGLSGSQFPTEQDAPKALELVLSFVNTPWSQEERHLRRVRNIETQQLQTQT